MKTWKNKFQKVLAILLAICLVTGCMGASKVQAATSKSGTTYYCTWLHRQKGGVQVYSGKKYYMTGTMKATCKGNTLTMYSSFNTSKNGTLNNQSKKAFVKYGKHTFKLTSKTKYCYYEEGGERYSTKAHFMSTVKRLNGLGLWIKVTNGKVVEMSFHS